MARVKYMMGDEVAHVDNLKLKLRVAGFTYTEKKHLKHITCRWWHGGENKKEDFHSHELIPWAIAEQGEVQVKDYLESLDIENRLKNMSEK